MAADPGTTRTRVLLAAFVLAAMAGMVGLLMEVERSNRTLEQIEARFVREHVLTIYNSQKDFLNAHVAALSASEADPDSWILRYEIAASRLETLRALASRPEASQRERSMTDAYAAFIARADATIAAAPDPLTAAHAIAVMAKEAQPIFVSLIDEGLHHTHMLRREWMSENESSVGKARLLTMVSLSGLVGFVAAVLRFTNALHVRNTKLTRLSAELRDALEMRRRFLAAISHDFRTPLNAISGFSQILLHDGIATPPEKQRSFLRHILDASRRLERMTGDLLDLAAIERGAFSLRLQDDVALERLAARIVDRFGPAAAAAEVRLSFEIASDAAARMRLDPDATERALSNLLENALKFSPPGESVTVAFAIEDGCAAISVEDHGPGIPPEEAERIWDMFWWRSRPREDGDEGPARQGSGLGLAIARGLVEAHGGSLDLCSALGLGSCFTIRLPLNGRPAAPVSDAAAA